MNVQTVHQASFVMELLSQLLVETAGHGIIVVGGQNIQPRKMVSLEGTALQGIFVLGRHQILFRVWWVKKMISIDLFMVLFLSGEGGVKHKLQ